MSKRLILYAFIAILEFFTAFNLSSILAKDIDERINRPIHRGEMQLDLKKNTKQAIPFPIGIDPRNPVAVESGSLGVGITLMRTEEPWISCSFSATQWKWHVRRPGDYSAKCLTGIIRSNVDVIIQFSDFEDLSSTNSPTQNLETYYSATLLDLTVEQVVWYRASDFNGHGLTIPQSPTDPVYWSLWNKVSVKNEISADEYKDDSVITLVMVNTKTWIDPGGSGGN